jgi:tetratricopeptide (TPR) repeat protein
MRTKLLLSTVLTAAIALSFAGCEAEHKKFVKESQQMKSWEIQRVGIMNQVAEQQYRVGELDKCRETLKQALAIDAPYAPIHILAAKVEMEGGSLEEAATHLKRAAALDGKDPESLYLLGVVYQRIQKFDTALGYYLQASEKNANEARYALAAAEMQITLGQLDDARQLLEDKVDFFEQSPAMHIALARIATLQGDPARAARCYRDATVLLPEDKNVRWSYAAALLDAGKHADAARILQNLRDDPPAPPKSPASLSAKTPDAVKAAEAETDAAAATSIRAGIVMMLGECYIGLNRPLDARDCFQEVIRLQPDNTTAYLSLGKTCLLTGEYNLTTAAAQKVLRLQPDNVNALILQATAQQKEKNYTGAQTTLARAAALAPADETVLCLQGLVAIQLGQKDAATAYLVKAVALNPSDTWAESLLEQVRPTPAPATPSPAPAPGGTSGISTPADSTTPIQAAQHDDGEPTGSSPPTVLATPESPVNIPGVEGQHP